MSRAARPAPPTDTSADPDLKRHGLRWTNDDEPGYRRVRRGKGWSFHEPDGGRLTNSAEVRRLKGLAVPPAWTDVWYCRDDQGHLQATGRDARGRKQYRYHPRWREVRDAAKYHQLLTFAEALPRLRRRVSRDLAREDLAPEKVLATVVRLLEESLIRVGNPEYARDNDTRGLTTLTEDHVDVKPRKGDLHFRFRGKGGKEWDLDIHDPRVAKVVAKCQDLPGQHLFQYHTGRGLHRVGSDDVNAYLQAHAHPDITAKDFRTWAGTVIAFDALSDVPPETRTQARRRMKATGDVVARTLRNTSAIARRCYVHPAVFQAFEDGRLAAARARAEARQDDAPQGLRQLERLVWSFLKDEEG